jgi:hypothetical protein
MSNQRSLGQRWADYRPTKAALVWACAGTAVATIVIGFAWGGWVTGGGARSMAASAATGAHDQLVAALCVERFQAAADAPAQLQALNDAKTWDRRNFIDKGGWTVVPGSGSLNAKAATLCADALLREGGQAGVIPIAQ